MANTKLFHGCPYEELPVTACNNQTMAQEILAAIEIMKPKPSPYALVRIGGTEDGSYLLPDDLAGIDACFSPGVNNRKEFEDELVMKYNIKTHMCDFTSNVEYFRTALITEMQTFRKLWLDINSSIDNISLKDWISELSPDPDTDIMLQVDIEGAEYRNIINCPDDVLGRFRVIVCEIHDLQQLTNHGIRRDILLPFLIKIDRQFSCVHAHPNNWGGRYYVKEIKTHVPKVIELTFIRRDRIECGHTLNSLVPLLPHPLDRVSTFRDPIPLDGAWIGYQPRPTAAAIKKLEDQVWFLEQSLSKLKGQLSMTVEAISYLDGVQQVSQKSYINKEALYKDDDNPSLKEVAIGQNFTISSGSPLRGIIPKNRNSNLFFHTDLEFHSSITIDLAVAQRIRRINIYNRTDACGERARLLLVNLTMETSKYQSEPIFLRPTEEFLNSVLPMSYDFDQGIMARFVKIWSPIYTALHFSGIEVYAENQDT